MYALDATSLYGAQPQAPSPGAGRPTEHMSIGAMDIEGGWKGLVDPRNPLVWFGLLLAITVGAAGVSGSVKVGPGKASASLGET